MYRRLSRAAHHNGNDAGIGMILVIGISAFLTAIIGVLVTVAINSLNGAHRHINFDLALTSAESGIDQGLSRLQAYYDTVSTSTNYTAPNNGIAGFDANPACKRAEIVAPAEAFDSTEEERTWAEDQFKTLVQTPGCVQHSAKGDYALIVPAPNPVTGLNLQSVYAMGWAPSYSATNHRARLVKAEYLFVPYSPKNAVLTAGSLEIDSSTTVNGVGTNVGDVHSNGSLSFTNGKPVVTGQASSTLPPSGQCKCGPSGNGSAIQTPAEPIPNISALYEYQHNALQNASIWFDLCPDGTVRKVASTTPCSGLEWNGGDAASVAAHGFNGWQFRGTNPDGSVTWGNLSNNPIANGIYYVVNGNVMREAGGGNPATDTATIIAQSKDRSCTKVGGNIQWNKNNITVGPALPGLFFLADSSLFVGRNTYAGNANSTPPTGGMFLAGDQVDLEQSSQADVGGVIAADQCPTSWLAQQGVMGNTNTIKNPTVSYLPNAANLFSTTIDTTLWLEFPGAKG